MVAAYRTARIIRFAQFDSSTVRLVRHSRSAPPSDFRGCSKFEDVDVDVGWGTRQKAFKQIPSLARALTARHRFSHDHESYASFNSEFTFTGS